MALIIFKMTDLVLTWKRDSSFFLNDPLPFLIDLQSWNTIYILTVLYLNLIKGTIKNYYYYDYYWYYFVSTNAWLFLTSLVAWSWSRSWCTSPSNRRHQGRADHVQGLRVEPSPTAERGGHCHHLLWYLVQHENHPLAPYWWLYTFKKSLKKM